MSTDEIRKEEFPPEETAAAEETCEAAVEEAIPKSESLTEVQQEETVVAEETVAEEAPAEKEQAAPEFEEEDEPIILIFPDEEEEETEEETVKEDAQENEEAYVPKAVMYRQNLGIEDKPKEKTAKEIAVEKICERAKLVRDGVAGMFERPLFNLPAWLSIGCMMTAASLVNLYTEITKMMYGIEGHEGEIEKSALAIVIGFVSVIAMSIIIFVGMRVTVVTSRNSGGNMTTAGISMVIVAVIILLIVACLSLLIYSIPVMIICVPCIVFLVSLLTSAIRVKKTIIDSVPRRISIICAIMCFAFAALNCWTFIYAFGEFDFTREGILAFLLNVFSIVSMFLFGIFIIAYNIKIRKMKKALKAE